MIPRVRGFGLRWLIFKNGKARPLACVGDGFMIVNSDLSRRAASVPGWSGSIGPDGPNGVPGLEMGDRTAERKGTDLARSELGVCSRRFGVDFEGRVKPTGQRPRVLQGLRISLGRLGALGKSGSQLWYSPAGRGSGAFCTLDC